MWRCCGATASTRSWSRPSTRSTKSKCTSTTPAGGFDTHFLEFDFNRVKSEGSLSHLLVTVNDVTKRVMLSRELQESQEKAQAQLDLLLRILHVEPDSLTGFLTDADVSLKMVNSILKEPAREESAFRAKIDGIYRQVHAVKGEAAALGLKTVEQRAHAFEESLSDLKGRQSLSGSDFLPLVVKLDDLFNHLAQVREMLSRLVDLHQAIATRGGTMGPRGSATSQVEAEKVDRWLAGESDEPQTQTHDKTQSMKRRSSRPPKPRPSRPAPAWSARSRISRRASPAASRSRSPCAAPAWTTFRKRIAARSRTSRFSWCATRSCTASKSRASAPRRTRPRPARWQSSSARATAKATS